MITSIIASIIGLIVAICIVIIFKMTFKYVYRLVKYYSLIHKRNIRREYHRYAKRAAIIQKQYQANIKTVMPQTSVYPLQGGVIRPQGFSGSRGMIGISGMSGSIGLSGFSGSGWNPEPKDEFREMIRHAAGCHRENTKCGDCRLGKIARAEIGCTFPIKLECTRITE